MTPHRWDMKKVTWEDNAEMCVKKQTNNIPFLLYLDKMIAFKNWPMSVRIDYHRTRPNFRFRLKLATFTPEGTLVTHYDGWVQWPSVPWILGKIIVNRPKTHWKWVKVRGFTGPCNTKHLNQLNFHVITSYLVTLSHLTFDRLPTSVAWVVESCVFKVLEDRGCAPQTTFFESWFYNCNQCLKSSSAQLHFLNFLLVRQYVDSYVKFECTGWSEEEKLLGPHGVLLQSLLIC